MPTVNTRIIINKQIALNFINAINNYFFTRKTTNHSDLFTFNFFVINPEELKQILNQKDKDAIKNYFKQLKPSLNILK